MQSRTVFKRSTTHRNSVFTSIVGLTQKKGRPRKSDSSFRHSHLASHQCMQRSSNNRCDIVRRNLGGSGVTVAAADRAGMSI
jgi:hypothetical protein